MVAPTPCLIRIVHSPSRLGDILTPTASFKQPRCNKLWLSLAYTYSERRHVVMGIHDHNSQPIVTPVASGHILGAVYHNTVSSISVGVVRPALRSAAS